MAFSTCLFEILQHGSALHKAVQHALTLILLEYLNFTHDGVRQFVKLHPKDTKSNMHYPHNITNVHALSVQLFIVWGLSGVTITVYQKLWGCTVCSSLLINWDVNTVSEHQSLLACGPELADWKKSPNVCLLSSAPPLSPAKFNWYGHGYDS